MDLIQYEVHNTDKSNRKSTNLNLRRPTRRRTKSGGSLTSPSQELHHQTRIKDVNKVPLPPPFTF